ncbi:hypothetical protein MTO96_011576 [Rhipicephalus appendiculatus]
MQAEAPIDHDHAAARVHATATSAHARGDNSSLHTYKYNVIQSTTPSIIAEFARYQGCTSADTGKRVGAPDDARDDPRGRTGSRYTPHEKQAAAETERARQTRSEVTDGRQRRRAARNDGYDSGLFERQRELLTYLTARIPSREGRQKWKRKRSSEGEKRYATCSLVVNHRRAPCLPYVARGAQLAYRCRVPSDRFPASFLFIYSARSICSFLDKAELRHGSGAQPLVVAFVSTVCSSLLRRRGVSALLSLRKQAGTREEEKTSSAGD